MSFEITATDVKKAYIKLKTHIYYDTSDLFIRRRLAKFESLQMNDEDFLNINREYVGNDIVKGLSIKLDEKFEIIAESINNNPSFFEPFFDKMKIQYMPKKFSYSEKPDNIITNKRIKKQYDIERASAFIDIPVELHLITVLWIMNYGKHYDEELSDYAYGNRLLLNKNRDDIIEGSGLFKPYYKQYQKWRDNAVNMAKTVLDSKHDIRFINIDIRDYYYSVRLDIDDLIRQKFTSEFASNNLLDLFKELHKKFTVELKENNFPFDYTGTIKDNQVVLPIGLLSSYIIGNYYLKNFDDKVINKVKPLYYGRYVDDIIFVIKDPSYSEIEKNLSPEKIIESDLSLLMEESKLPEHILVKNKSKKCIKFKDEEYETLLCQSEKTLIYHFDHNESDLVIDKLKQELDERASEFRDFPSEEENYSFESKAYHLMYEGTEGKLKTLKDYKENRYGLSIFLSNKIFIALRQNNKIKIEESKKILKFFKGLNSLDYFRLWEKILTFFMVNNDPESYVDFYIHTFNQINSIKLKPENKKIKLKDSEVKRSLLDYLDCALEMTHALYPKFVRKSKRAQKKLSFFQSQQENWFSYLQNTGAEPTNENSFHITRFRESNLIRHHYVIQPLINYTNIVNDKNINLTSLKIPLNLSGNKKLKFVPKSLDNSPRRIKFWECCIAVIYIKLADSKKLLKKREEDYKIELFDVNFIDSENKKEFNSYLDEAFDLYEKINKVHIAGHNFDYDNLKDSIYKIHEAETINKCDLVEFRINSEDILKKVRISFANTEVKPGNILSSVRAKPVLNSNRYDTFRKIFKYTREEKANMLLLPENSLPYQFLSSLARFSVDNSIMSVSGLEHWTIGNYSFNFIVNILPVKINNINDAVVLIRLKNHYAPPEQLMINKEHLYCPKPIKYRYDLINWRNIYFSTFYCFELANSMHRSLLKSKVDLLIASEWNKDTPYYSNIVESLSRDIHAYVAQINTSQYGDSRLTKPSSTATKDILKLKGGVNDTVLIGEIEFASLREFQRQRYNYTRTNKDFKPLPPDFNYKNAIKREENKPIL